MNMMDTLEKINAIAQQTLDKVFQFLTQKYIWKYGYLLLAFVDWRFAETQSGKVIIQQLCSSNNVNMEAFITGLNWGGVIGIWLCLFILESLGKLYSKLDRGIVGAKNER